MIRFPVSCRTCEESHHFHLYYKKKKVITFIFITRRKLNLPKISNSSQMHQSSEVTGKTGGTDKQTYDRRLRLPGSCGLADGKMDEDQPNKMLQNQGRQTGLRKKNLCSVRPQALGETQEQGPRCKE